MKKSKFRVFVSVILFPFYLYGQSNGGEIKSENLKDWYNADPMTEKIQGVSVDKAYEYLKKKKSTKVIVAVIDSGVDIDHEDLQGQIWINEGEIAGNGIDDDKNGYVDDVYGWSFIGGKDGNVQQDTHELTREYVRLKNIYGEKEKKSIPKKNIEEYEYWKTVRDDFEGRIAEANKNATFYQGIHHNLIRFNEMLKNYLDVEKLSGADLQKVQSSDSIVFAAVGFLGNIARIVGNDVDFDYVIEDLKGAVKYYTDQVEYTYNVNFDPRSIVGDNYDDLYERYYGNNDVKGPDPNHGTHVAGIIAAKRGNDLGIDGVASNVVIMPVRAVPDGDERDKDVANAIIYAVDNGAKIINMSFGKSYSPGKEAVDKAIKYAQSKGVLLVHAAGNSSKNTDKGKNYPSRRFNDNTEASTWLEVGASSWGEGADFVGSFSNFGKKTVDLFAPGVQIYSTTPNNEYESFDGTSMASPVTAGVAALLMSYYPDLSAAQIKEILLSSTRKFDHLKVTKPGSEDEILFSDLSITGGIVNAYEAVKMAESMKIEKN